MQWGSKDSPLGAFIYSSYTEEDYSTIWDEYLYISKDNWWVDMDFGKLNCSNAAPRRADVAPAMRQAWSSSQQARCHASSSSVSHAGKAWPCMACKCHLKDQRWAGKLLTECMVQQLSWFSMLGMDES